MPTLQGAVSGPAPPILVTVVGWSLLLVAGLAGALALVVVVRRRAEADGDRSERGHLSRRDRPAGLGSDALRVLAALPAASVILDPSGDTVLESDRAVALGLVRDGRAARRDVDELVRAVASDGRARETDVVVAPRRRGALEQTLRVRVSPLVDGLVLLLAEDVSEARRVEAVRRDFVANVSHELKTPVGALVLLAEATQAAADDPETVRRFGSRIEEEAQRLSRMVDDLLDLSRLQDDDPLASASRVDVDVLIERALDETRLVAESSSITLLDGGTTGLAVFGQEPQLLTALRNLIVNAVAYSPPGTRVAIARRVVGDDVEISVTDQGVGIAENDQPRIFERFYRVDPARSRHTGGTGLGLAIVRRVCENHGGEVTVWSRLGKGSTFTLRLPVHADMLAASDADAAADMAQAAVRRDDDVAPRTDSADAAAAAPDGARADAPPPDSADGAAASAPDAAGADAPSPADLAAAEGPVPDPAAADRVSTTPTGTSAARPGQEPQEMKAS